MATYIFQPASIDTYLFRATATTNYGDNTRLRSGETTDGSNGEARTCIKFNQLSDGTIPSAATILSAVLEIYLYDSRSSESGAHRVYRLKRAWVEMEATWNIWKTGSNWSTAGGFHENDCEQTHIATTNIAATPEDGWVAWNLDTAAIQEIVSGSWANNGFLIKALTELNNQHWFRSSDYGTASTRPKLTVITAGPPKVKTINGIANADIKTINGIAVADIASIQSLT